MKMNRTLCNMVDELVLDMEEIKSFLHQGVDGNSVASRKARKALVELAKSGKKYREDSVQFFKDLKADKAENTSS